MKINILLIEDDIRLSGMIKAILEHKGFEVYHVQDGVMGLQEALKDKYQIILCDVMLPSLSGLAICEKLLSHQTETPILMLSALDSTSQKVHGLEAGADDYLVKPFAMDELLARVSALLRRKEKSKKLPPQLIYADLVLDFSQKKVYRAGESITLTPKEFELLQFFMQHPEEVISRAELAKQVWGITFDTKTNFVDVYINYLRNKIDKPFNQKLIQTRTGLGFVLSKLEQS